MQTVSGCNLPEDLYYWVEKHVWARPEPDGLVTIGITDVAQHLAAKIVAVTPKKVGKTLGAGQSTATVESGKWVGPVPTPVAGEVVAVNERLRGSPELANTDPYGEGWVVRLRPSDWAGESGKLAHGPAGIESYGAFLEAQGIRCGA